MKSLGNILAFASIALALGMISLVGSSDHGGDGSFMQNDDHHQTHGGDGSAPFIHGGGGTTAPHGGAGV